MIESIFYLIIIIGSLFMMVYIPYLDQKRSKRILPRRARK